MKKRRLGPASPPTSMQGTPPFQNEVVAPTIEDLRRAGIVSSDPNAAKAKPAGSSPALRIACPVCKAPVGVYCTRIKPLRYVVTGVQRIAHKKRRELEERTR
jgi:hypothetical protein